MRDAGIGFGPDGAERMFDAFYTTKGDGMGIGLSVSRAIIERHDGRIWAGPNDGPGATFSLAIPCYSGNAMAFHADAKEGTGRTPSKVQRNPYSLDASDRWQQNSQAPSPDLH